jgi:hypothetical protein
MPDQFQDLSEWASGVVPSEGELVLSLAEVEAIVDGVMSTLGELHTDLSDMPGSATSRPRGAFTLPDDLRIYLDNGGLLTYDASGNPVSSGRVHILKRPQADGPHTIYEVWIDEES